MPDIESKPQGKGPKRKNARDWLTDCEVFHVSSNSETPSAHVSESVSGSPVESRHP